MPITQGMVGGAADAACGTRHMYGVRPFTFSCWVRVATRLPGGQARKDADYIMTGRIQPCEQGNRVCTGSQHYDAHAYSIEKKGGNKYSLHTVGRFHFRKSLKYDFIRGDVIF